MSVPPEDGGGTSLPAREEDVTRLLAEADAGDAEARERLLRTVYDELRKIAASQMAGERRDHTLGATALVSETYLRLFRDAGGSTPAVFSYEHRHAFYKAAAVAMRRILIDHARARAAEKRGGARAHGRIPADLLEASTSADPADLLALDEALDRLEREDERAATVVRLRFFTGCTMEQIGEMLGVAHRTAKRDWEYARARLRQIIDETPREDGA